MATNPKLPDYPDTAPRRSAHPHGGVQLIRQSKFPWAIAALIVVAALLIAIIAVLPRSPGVSKLPVAAQVPSQPTAEQIQLTDIKIVPAPAGDALYLDVILHNTGNSAITGAQVNAQFLSKTGRELGTETAAVKAWRVAARQPRTWPYHRSNPVKRVPYGFTSSTLRKAGTTRYRS